MTNANFVARGTPGPQGAAPRRRTSNSLTLCFFASNTNTNTDTYSLHVTNTNFWPKEQPLGVEFCLEMQTNTDKYYNPTYT